MVRANLKQKFSRISGIVGLMALAAGVLVTGGQQASAAFVVKPDAANTSSNLDDSRRSGTQAIDGSGLSSGVATGDPVPSTWPSHNNGGLGEAWLNEESDTVDRITFDLGQSFDLTGVHVWNYNSDGFTKRSVKDVDISFSTTAIDSGFGTAQSFTLNQAKGTTSYTGEDRSFSGSPVTARYIKFDALSHYGSSKDRLGLSEVRFMAVPEPASLALLAPAGLLLLSRRRAA